MMSIFLYILLYLCVSSSSYNLISGTGNKKGVAFDSGNTLCSDLTSINSLGYYYSYTTTSPCSTSVTSAEFLPQIWSHATATTSNINSLPSSSILLSFNEPNRRDQANMTPQQAATDWSILESANRVLVSPSVSTCQPNNPNDPACLYDPFVWLDDFFADCTGCRVDYIGFHSYTCSIAAVLNWITEIQTKYNKPVFFTEIACSSSSQFDNYQFMKEIIPILDQSPYVAGYFWFSTRIATTYDGNGNVNSLGSALYTGTNSAVLTTAGTFYSGFQSGVNPTVPSHDSISGYTNFPTSIPVSGTITVPIQFDVKTTNYVEVDLVGPVSPYYYTGTNIIVAPGQGNYIVTINYNALPPTLVNVTITMFTLNYTVYQLNPGTAYEHPTASMNYLVPVNHNSGSSSTIDSSTAGPGQNLNDNGGNGDNNGASQLTPYTSFYIIGLFSLFLCF